jgi:WD40 repeat protein
MGALWRGLGAALGTVGLLAGGILGGSISDARVNAPVSQVLAYATGNGSSDYVWLADANGRSPHRVGRGDAPLLSPDHVHVAALRFAASGPAVVIYGGARTLSPFDLRTTTVDLQAWSPDGRYLAVGMYSTAVRPRISQYGIAVVDTQTGSVTTVGHGYPCGVSFAPSGTLRFVFGLGGRVTGCDGAVDIFRVTAGAPTGAKLTHDRRSANPVWGTTGIAFTHLTARHNDYSTAQIWEMDASGHHVHALTHQHIGPLVSGLYPVAFSADGKHLLARFSGQDTDEAWTLDLHGNHLRRLTVHGQPILPGAISRDGSTVLGVAGDPLGPPINQTIVTLPFGGGHATVLLRRAGSPSWTR